MNKQYIEDHDIAIKYLRNQLSSQELEEFEVYLIENPEMIEQLELDQALSKELPLVETLEKNESNTLKGAWFNPLNKDFLGGHPATTFAAFCGGVLLTLAFGLFQTKSIMSPPIKYAINLGDLRSADDMAALPVYEFSSESTTLFGKEKFILVLDAPYNKQANYKVEISEKISDQSKRIKQHLTVTANDSGSVVLLLNVKKFKQGMYQVDVSSDEYQATTFFKTTMSN